MLPLKFSYTFHIRRIITFFNVQYSTTCHNYFQGRFRQTCQRGQPGRGVAMPTVAWETAPPAHDSESHTIWWIEYIIIQDLDKICMISVSHCEWSANLAVYFELLSIWPRTWFIDNSILCYQHFRFRFDISSIHRPANTRCWCYDSLMLGHHHRRWTSTKKTLCCFVFRESYHPFISHHYKSAAWMSKTLYIRATM